MSFFFPTRFAAAAMVFAFQLGIIPSLCHGAPTEQAQQISPSPTLAQSKPTASLQDLTKKMQERDPELKCVWSSTKDFAPPAPWEGEEHLRATFSWAGIQLCPGESGPPAEGPAWGLFLTVDRHDSLDGARKHIEKTLRERSVMPKKETYKGVTLYRYNPYGTVVCQVGVYVFEISSRGHYEISQAQLDHLVDLVLAELSAASPATR